MLKEKLTKYFPLYIKSLIYNAKESTLKIKLDDLTDNPKIKFKINFSNVAYYAEYLNNKIPPLEDDLKEQLIEIDERKESDKTRYIIITEEREISFLTDTLPIIKK